jgi:hypothetical protein
MTVITRDRHPAHDVLRMPHRWPASRTARAARTSGRRVDDRGWHRPDGRLRLLAGRLRMLAGRLRLLAGRLDDGWLLAGRLDDGWLLARRVRRRAAAADRRRRLRCGIGGGGRAPDQSGYGHRHGQPTTNDHTITLSSPAIRPATREVRVRTAGRDGVHVALQSCTHRGRESLRPHGAREPGAPGVVGSRATEQAHSMRGPQDEMPSGAAVNDSCRRVPGNSRRGP